jgi:hypothetical protein
MTIPRVLIVAAFLCCLFFPAPAQIIRQCNTRASVPQNPDTPFPNELEGLKFYGKGKLSSITFGVSGIDDVRGILGAPLQSRSGTDVFDYDADWLIVFGYFYAGFSTTSTYTSENGVGVTKKYVLNPEYIGKINYIILRPKKSFPFSRTSNSDDSLKEYRQKNDKFYRYADRDGLTYKVYDGDAGRLIYGLGKTDVTISRADLMEIEYIYSCFKNKDIYVEQK